MSRSDLGDVPVELLPVSGERSGCPINMAVEVLGDRWTLIVLRDIVFGGHRHFRDLLKNSMEGIASNILASRLAKLVEAGLLTRNEDPSHRQKIDYRLTEAAIQLVPIFAHLGQWGARWLPTAPELAIRSRLLIDGGPALWEQFMAELREVHIKRQEPPVDGVLATLTRAYEDALQTLTGLDTPN